MPYQISGLIVYIYVALVLVGIFLTLIRFLLGPTAPDRVVATDILTTITTVLLVLLSLLSKRGIYLDVALVYAVLAFTAVVAIARYLEGGL